MNGSSITSDMVIYETNKTINQDKTNIQISAAVHKGLKSCSFFHNEASIGYRSMENSTHVCPVDNLDRCWTYDNYENRYRINCVWTYDNYENRYRINCVWTCDNYENRIRINRGCRKTYLKESIVGILINVSPSNIIYQKIFL